MRLARKILLASLLPLCALALATVFAPTAPLEALSEADVDWLSQALQQARRLFA